MYATILVHNNPVSPTGLELWDMFKDRMSEDYQNEPNDTRYHKALGVSYEILKNLIILFIILSKFKHLRYILEGFGRRLSDYNLPEPDERGLQWRHREIPANFDDMTVEEHRQTAEAMVTTLNNEQRVRYLNKNSNF